MAKFLSLDRIPVIALLVLTLTQWWGASYFHAHGVQAKPSPFTPMWALYDEREGRVLVLAFAAALVMALLPPLGGEMLAMRNFSIRISGSISRMQSYWFWVVAAALVVIFASRGPYLLYSPAYLAYIGPAILASASTLMGPLGLIAAGALSVRRPYVGKIFSLAIAATLFAAATRVFSGVLLLYLLGRFLGGKSPNALSWLMGTSFSLASLPVPLYCRNYPTHGLIPYISAVRMLISQGSYGQRIALDYGENMGMTIPLLTYVAHYHIPVGNMIISLNPEPTGMAGWGEIAGQMRVHDFIPFSSLGEWASFGWLALFGFGLVWALVVRMAVTITARLGGALGLLLVVMQLALSMLQVVEMGQYNTRAIARLADMMVLLAIGSVLARQLFPRLDENKSLQHVDPMNIENGAV